jgi:hypothetical protein
VDAVFAPGQELPPHDVSAYLLSLPRLLGTTSVNIPANVPYLAPEDALVQRWRGELERYQGFKVGLCWQGDPKHKRDRLRSIPLAQLAPLSALPGVRLFGLQVGRQRSELEGGVIDLGGRFDSSSFADAAAVVNNLDLVISVDTSVAHLAGALGAPVWVLLPTCADWRWLREREDSPWYPSMRLFRQVRLGHWDDVVQRLAGDLRQLVARKAAP